MAGSKLIAQSLCLCLCASLTFADVYLHIPRGSNNRLNEKSANRQNANRIFDSQNNNRGGYNMGDATDRAANNDVAKQYLMKYFMSAQPGQGESYMNIEWTNQHGCGGTEDGDPHKQNCQLVMQYMCQEESVAQNDRDKIRPGTQTQTQNHNPSQNPANENLGTKIGRKNGDVQAQRGLNEPWEWYDKCYNRERNKGLFTADQVLKSKNRQGFSAAIYTRQNPNGNRNGYECPEERDHYPYWHPTPWLDIAVLTDNTSMCDFYTENSFNVKPYGECVELYSATSRRHSSRWNNPAECAANGGTWTEFYNYIEKSSASNEAQCVAQSKPGLRYIWAVPVETYNTEEIPKAQCLVQPAAPVCQQAPWSRSNHLGNGREGAANTFQWKLPHFPSGTEKRCVFRLRYNISTDDYDPWRTNSSFNKDLQAGVVSPVQQNPYVDVGADVTALRLAINTAQFGRTFQDRSHPFTLRPRPADMTAQNIHNLNVRGKRGNIVQVYPAVEYDFAPNDLTVKEGELVHIQWTGSNTHNNGNPGGDGQTGDAGEGTGGTDRNNFVEMMSRDQNYPVPFERSTFWDAVTPVWVSYDNKGAVPSGEDLAVSMASSGYYKCMKAADCQDSVENKAAVNNLLNNAPASYEGAVLRIKKGTYYYMCTRNNNFTNRSQKGSITVQ